MPVILSIETATSVCSAALSRDGQLLSLRESAAGNAHSSVLTSFIEQVFASAGLRPDEADAIAVSEGPGSYTGLRIGTATAKGLCYALEKPLIAVSTLKSMAAGMMNLAPGARHSSLVTYFCPMIDARRMEVFSAVYDEGLNEVREIRAEIISELSFADLLVDHRIIFAGNGAVKCGPVLEKYENAKFPEGFQVSASHMIRLAEEKYQEGLFEDLAYFEPRYLKEFVAGKPRVKGLDRE